MKNYSVDETIIHIIFELIFIQHKLLIILLNTRMSCINHPRTKERSHSDRKRYNQSSFHCQRNHSRSGNLNQDNRRFRTRNWCLRTTSRFDRRRVPLWWWFPVAQPEADKVESANMRTAFSPANRNILRQATHAPTSSLTPINYPTLSLTLFRNSVRDQMPRTIWVGLTIRINN